MKEPKDSSSGNLLVSPVQAVAAMAENRTSEAARQLFCGGIAGSVAKTVTAPFSRLTILFQVHSLVTTRENRPRFAMSLSQGVHKIIERGGIRSMWKGNMTSVLHRFPYSAINFFVYEETLDLLSGMETPFQRQEPYETPAQLTRRLTTIIHQQHDEEEEPQRSRAEDTPAMHKFMAGATAGTCAVLGCYPLDLVRTRLTTELEGAEHYRGIVDAFQKIHGAEGFRGFYSGVGPTLFVAVPNFAISYTVYGSLKEYTLDDDLFYNLRKIDAGSGEPKLGFSLTIMCGASSGILATLVTFPMDTIRRRMQIQNLHVPETQRLGAVQQFRRLVHHEGLASVYRGLTPELLKVVPMVGTMFVVYEWSRDLLNVTRDRR